MTVYLTTRRFYLNQTPLEFATLEEAIKHANYIIENNVAAPGPLLDEDGAVVLTQEEVYRKAGELNE